MKGNYCNRRGGSFHGVIEKCMSVVNDHGKYITEKIIDYRSRLRFKVIDYNENVYKSLKTRVNARAVQFVFR